MEATVDCKHGILTGVDVYPANEKESLLVLRHLEQQIKLGVPMNQLALDRGYDTGAVHRGLELLGVTGYIPAIQFPNAPEKYGFSYNPQRDAFICPEGVGLTYHRLNCNQSTGKYLRCYQIEDDACKHCVKRPSCFDKAGIRRRVLASSCYPAFFRGHQRVGTPEFLSMMRLRKIWAEGSFSVLKREHCISKIRKRGILAATEECLLAAMALNLKKDGKRRLFLSAYFLFCRDHCGFRQFLAFVNGSKQELYLKQRPEELEKLVEIAKVQSTEASNAIEGIVTTNTRIRQLVEEKTAPRNRDEQEIAGYRDVLNLIHENFDAIPITQNYILQLHKILYSHRNNPMAGRTKSVQNYISATYPDGHVETLFTPLAPYETPEALDRICEEYNRVIGNMEVEPLIVIPVFIHDFLCIHPFNDGNGRMSRLLTTLLLYRSGFYVGKYISLEAKIAKNKDLYYDVLRQAQIGWHEGTEDVVPFIKYLLGIILSAYKDFEDRFALVDTKLPAMETVRRATMEKNRPVYEAGHP